MSLKEELATELGSLMYHVHSVKIFKDHSVHGEDAIKVEARKPAENGNTAVLEATHLKRNKMTDEEMAVNFADKVHLWVKGTLEEV